MSDYLISDNSFVKDYVRFTYISDRRFSIDSVTGDIKIQRHLDPLRLHYVRVYLRYNGTVKSTKRLYSATTSVLIRIYTKGKWSLLTYIYIYIYIYIYMYVCMYICMYVCMYICNTFTPQIKVKFQCIHLILHWLYNVNEIYALLSVHIISH